MYAIFDIGARDYVCEDFRTGKNAPILVFRNKKAAFKRAAEMFGYENYSLAKKQGWCEVVVFPTTLDEATRLFGEYLKKGN